jgi:calsyntenin 1
MSQYFRGYLAGLSILKNKTESDSVIQCLNNCQEKLDFDAIDTSDDTVNKQS